MANFPSTQWSLIRASGESPSERHGAFGQLAQGYRAAIVAYFRAHLDRDAAEDATQSFLAASFEHAWWSRADAHAGSFRGFLCMLLRRHLGHLREGRTLTVADSEVVELALDPGASHQQQFDARFALTLMAHAVARLRADYARRARTQLLECLLPLLSSPPEHGELKAIAASLAMPANSLSIELTRIRARLRTCMQVELRELCADELAFDADWAVLQQILGAR